MNASFSASAHANHRYDETHPHGRPTSIGSTLGTAMPATFVAGVCILNGAGQILAGFNKKRFVWDIPQGVVEAHETEAESALRELAEETGLIYTADKLEPLGSFHHRTPEFVYPFTNTLYLVEDRSGYADNAVNLEPDKCEHLKWFAPCQLPFPRGLSLRIALTLLGHS
jgi:8-oxo-dGTP pyrophosphatase MutT (NUDIX family)